MEPALERSYGEAGDLPASRAALAAAVAEFRALGMSFWLSDAENVDT